MEKPLLDWYAQNARSLPWREDPTPYHVWVSEIMLQQTRVEAVRPYYWRFMERLPDIAALSACPEETLLKLWEGLGYYSRARNLKKTADIILRDYGGRLPEDVKELRSLPGIGSYTAGAIASIACSKAVPAVDGNVLRVMSRLCENEEDVLQQSVKNALEKTIAAVIPADAPGMYNQALMELGALICLPGGAASCEICPVRELCLSRLHGSTERIPLRRPKKERRLEERPVLIIRDALRGIFSKRPAKGLLAGLYELPSLPGHCREEDVLTFVRSLSLSPVRITALPAARHLFTHVEWRMTGFLVLVEDMEETAAAADTFRAAGIRDENGNSSALSAGDSCMLAVEPSRTKDEFAIPSAFRAYAPYMEIDIGNMRFRQDQRMETVPGMP